MAIYLFTAVSKDITANMGGQGTTYQDELEATMDAFKKNKTDIIQDYAAQEAAIEHAYREYQRIAAEEYQAYERQLLQYWPDAQISTKKRWVEYSSDYQTRQAVDFEKKEIIIDIITDVSQTSAPSISETPDIDQLFQQRLAALLQEDQQAAFERDQLAQNIERKLLAQSNQAKTDQLSRQPILSGVVTGTEHPSPQDIEQAARQLQNTATLSRQPSNIPGKQIVRLRTALPANTLEKKAAQYQPAAERFARERGLTSALVLAVIHTESAFNPMARSHVPAYGLMQIVPQSAGKDVSQRLFGEPLLLSPSYLYNSTNNINVGTTYLYILYYNYLKTINNPTSRLYCTIAAYNTGAGNVARAFVGTNDVSRAATLINQMPPENVYRHLITNLPYQETRDYLQRVCRRIEAYQAM